MKNIIGLGAAGCNLANAFEAFKFYKIYRIDTSESGPIRAGTRFFHIKKYKNPESYEEHIPDLKSFFRGLKGDILFIVGGSGNISNASLVILEQIKHCNINVMYIKPDLSFLSKEALLQERVVYNVFQQYARSGVFNKLILIDNLAVEKILDGAPIIGYYEKLNEVISSTFHMINIYKKIEAVNTTFSSVPDGAKISTIGIVDPETNETKLFFPLDNISDSLYYYAFNEEKLKNSKNIFNNIKNNIKAKDSLSARKAYGIYATNYEQDYAYIEAYTSIIQE